MLITAACMHSIVAILAGFLMRAEAPLGWVLYRLADCSVIAALSWLQVVLPEILLHCHLSIAHAFVHRGYLLWL